jgi:hypothetical protein
MKSFYKENPFGEDLFSRILSECNEIDKSFNIGQYSTRFGRYDSVFEFSKDIESKLIEIAKKEFNEPDLEITYNQVTRYQIVDGNVPQLFMHVDTLPSTHTIDVCLDTTVPEWGLEVKDGENVLLFKDKKGSAVFLKGDEDEHGRPPYPSQSPSDYCKMLFINLAPSTHWSAIARKKLGPTAIKQQYYPLSVTLDSPK